MRKIYLLGFLLMTAVATAMGQYVDNALQFSMQNYGSTARSKAMGNAFGALGGDFGSLSINPAGIGIYLRGEVSTTLSMLNNGMSTTYQQNVNSENNSNLNFKNFGYVSVLPLKDKSSGLVSLNFGLGYNRLASFNQSSFTSANASPHSRMDAFAQNTNGIAFSNLVSSSTNDPYSNGIPWESKLSWENYLIDVSNPNAGGNMYTTFLFADEKVKQEESLTHEGFINEYIATVGANFNYNLYLGATLGMQDLFYDEAKLYHEDGLWGNFDYTNSNRTTGVGYNLKLGAIYRPIPELRFGAAFHTPTLFKLKESYSAVMSSNLLDVNADANGTHKEETPIGNYEYKFNSPLRAIGSVAYQFGKSGLVSFDYEYVDYSKMKYSKGNDGYRFGSENGEIGTIYKAVSNLRFGAEYRMTDLLSLRGGLELMGNPYKSNAYGVAQPNADFQFKTYNAGIGYRNGGFSADLTYSLGDRTNYQYMYQVDGIAIDPVKYHSLRSDLMLTVAIRL